ncbi:bifunctional enoyl-CoA hydratase/phosphate acetyltransferase [Acidimangrovimonas sediminis]|uniref:bifunctional enoyl-CoA hydratase/phosphate acetyltransferase n=1 Tax=Acidimangrovimonas sediminis TaxID=2056283 RepID=UPI000C7FAEB6|nr:bifunctional enoyl-CoA hydratase/phosphate acetyltransferase [Acidimangrovimonas sediminis]
MDTTPDLITNLTFEEIAPGQSASLTRTLTIRDIELFATVSGDMNPAHVDPEFARSDLFHKVIAHGMWGASLISTVLGTQLPGPGTIYLDQSLRFLGPIGLGDTVTVTVTAREKDEKHHRITFDCRCVDQSGKVVIDGVALVIAPTEKVSRPRVVLPTVTLRQPGAKFRAIIRQAEALPPLPTAVVHPVDANALGGAVAAAQAGLIAPVLVGPAARIRAAAEEAGLDIAPYRLVATEHSAEAAATAARLAHEGEVQALMKGSLHTDEFLHPVMAAENNLRTAARLSHVFLMDMPSYDRLLFISDGAINIAPDLSAKRDIVQNAIDMAHALGIAEPRVAILSAVEVVNPRIPSTLDAAALCKMAERGQICGGIVDGPLAFDNAVSPAAASTKHIVSPVAGAADILIAPDLDAGNMIAKQLEYLAGAAAAGVVLGARVPIILTSRADDAQSRLASCAVAALIRAHKAAGGAIAGAAAATVGTTGKGTGVDGAGMDGAGAGQP